MRMCELDLLRAGSGLTAFLHSYATAGLTSFAAKLFVGACRLIELLGRLRLATLWVRFSLFDFLSGLFLMLPRKLDWTYLTAFCVFFLTCL